MCVLLNYLLTQLCTHLPTTWAPKMTFKKTPPLERPKNVGTWTLKKCVIPRSAWDVYPRMTARASYNWQSARFPRRKTYTSLRQRAEAASKDLGRGESRVAKGEGDPGAVVGEPAHAVVEQLDLTLSVEQDVLGTKVQVDNVHLVEKKQRETKIR